MQTGTAEALELLLELFAVLELDRKAQLDWFLLAITGLVGRTEANEVLWELLTTEALGLEATTLSNLLSSRCSAARKNFERPPAEHPFRRQWGWARLEVPRNPHFSPRDPCTNDQDLPLCANPGGVPRTPPWCYMRVREYREF